MHRLHLSWKSKYCCFYFGIVSFLPEFARILICKHICKLNVKQVSRVAVHNAGQCSGVGFLKRVSFHVPST